MYLLCQVGLPQLCVDNVVKMWVEHWRECKFYLAEELKTKFFFLDCQVYGVVCRGSSLV